MTIGEKRPVRDWRINWVPFDQVAVEDVLGLGDAAAFLKVEPDTIINLAKYGLIKWSVDPDVDMDDFTNLRFLPDWLTEYVDHWRQSAAEACIAEYKKTGRVSARSFDNPFEGRRGYLYVITDKGGLFKIGITVDPSARLGGLHTTIPGGVTKVLVRETSDMKKFERAIHERFRDKRVHGEWFQLDDDDLAIIRRMRAK
jgi:hypothetical protein